MDFIVLPSVWISAKAREKCVARIPICWKERTIVIIDRGVVVRCSIRIWARLTVWVGVLTEAAVNISTNSASLRTIRNLCGEVQSIWCLRYP